MLLNVGTVLMFKPTGKPAVITAIRMSQNRITRHWETVVSLANPLEDYAGDDIPGDKLAGWLDNGTAAVQAYAGLGEMVMRQLFPLPAQEVLLGQVSEPLPFRYFGLTGGYGRTRRELVRAIEEADRARIEPLYYELIREGLNEPDPDRPPEFWAAAKHLAESVGQLR